MSRGSTHLCHPERSEVSKGTNHLCHPERSEVSAASRTKSKDPYTISVLAPLQGVLPIMRAFDLDFDFDFDFDVALRQ